MYPRIEDGFTLTMCVGTETRMLEVENSNYGDQSSNNSRDEVDRGMKEETRGGGEGDSMDQNHMLKEKNGAHGCYVICHYAG